ncbi:hypothetical protein [Heyndrickxia sporothermodurans]|uniref:hypothetical protein n=1 Tax=Heyndrickxia sporothermodurans TaxID=46224 RepID=UPI000D3919DF|nr:hypothetical protein [Heyndrickxia sporothermodurans]PTY92868.1 hypothetical protein B5V90_01975 [Heyndrickxia sporothermodurans]
MQQPKISWFVKEQDGSFMSKEEHHAGTYTKQEQVVVEFQVWNNRWGVEDVLPLADPVLNFYFDTLEDSSLLHLCKITIDDMGVVPLVIKGEKASARIGRTLSGKQNNGDANSIDNTDNYVTVKFEFSAEDYRLKENDLKNVYFELVSMS